ncbi:site-specific integrase [Nostoc sp. 'Peltigera malacea cyanobiont' DB3992]|uniref:site-specific integrase n=1 Tax=Nostoc sp. 'Peltigera malacea cyanobiont' DB3992 TaxID=1206980 RepID=UPI00211E63E3|nr:site-specific integrase [Nostoc sp. 'Peltigera malacea cyanobiont' DB3992]
MLILEVLKERLIKSELGQEWIKNPLLFQDIWSIEELGYTEEECKIGQHKNIYFHGFSLSWLKLLTKLTVLATIRQKFSLDTATNRITYLRQLDEFLLTKGYSQPEDLTDTLLREYVSQRTTKYRQSCIAYAVRLWDEEGWVKLSYTHIKIKKKLPKIETIPEEVLYQIYNKFDLFPPPLERLFRLQLVLGCRIGEMLRMPRQCLKQEGNKWFLLRWIEKRKQWQFYEIHHLVTELVREQQKFLDFQLGADSKFDNLFCNVDVSSHRSRGKFQVEPVYQPEILTYGGTAYWLRGFREEADLKDKYGNKFELTSHHFRRTKASIMAYCDAEDEYIAAVLGHGSLDMLPHYRQRSLERLEKEANSKGYVDKYGQVSSFKPRKLRYEKLAEILKVSTPLGECHRPTILGDCQSRYACLSCDHHRVTLEDKTKLEADYASLKQDLQQATTVGQDRRVTEINRLLN